MKFQDLDEKFEDIMDPKHCWTYKQIKGKVIELLEVYFKNKYIGYCIERPDVLRKVYIGKVLRVIINKEHDIVFQISGEQGKVGIIFGYIDYDLYEEVVFNAGRNAAENMWCYALENGGSSYYKNYYQIISLSETFSGAKLLAELDSISQ